MRAAATAARRVLTPPRALLVGVLAGNTRGARFTLATIGTSEGFRGQRTAGATDCELTEVAHNQGVGRGSLFVAIVVGLVRVHVREVIRAAAVTTPAAPIIGLLVGRNVREPCGFILRVKVRVSVSVHE